jgi:hypothetical protein
MQESYERHAHMGIGSLTGSRVSTAREHGCGQNHVDKAMTTPFVNHHRRVAAPLGVRESAYDDLVVSGGLEPSTSRM